MTKSSCNTSAGEYTNSSPEASLSALLRLLSPIFTTHWSRLAAGFLALITVDFLQLIIPRFIKTAVDGLTAQSATSSQLLTLSMFVLLIAGIVAVLRFFWRYLIIGFSRILEKKLRDRLFNHILRMDQQFFERWTIGDLMAHAGNDLATVQMACGMGLVAAVDALVMSAAALGFMLAISVKLTLIALLPMPVLIVCTRILSGRLHQRFNLVQEQFSLLTEFARTTLVSIRLIKAYTLENFQGTRFQSLGEAYIRSNLRVAIIQGLLFPVATLVGNVGMLLLLYYGGMLVIEDTITIGSFVAFVSYLYMLIWPMMAIGWVANLTQRGITSLRRIHRLLEQLPAVSRGITQPLPLPQTTIGTTYSCRHLTFTYAGTARPALNELNMEIGPGLTGLTGRTGSGKSTLCKLLLRMYPVEDGMLVFRGVDVNRLSQADIRDCIAYVSQEPVVFATTIAANIAFGRPEATMAEIKEAAATAAIDMDIQGFSEGYATVIGERGVKLSGGQRQRLALARALLCKRPLLIIDDGLSAIDVETEQLVLENILNNMDGQSILLVSHRVNVLRHADHIFILDNGRIVGQGGHQELLAHPFYSSMVAKQRSHA
ncbi:ABC transporter ATP-binding protein [Desulfobulbus oligotrophicus]|jgi:ATP-binding cassette subfamily B protein|uniref:ATP-binding cassette domain-containing protein n=1 Tax=Desulfobulbus oligotrophicus TaxID=1909699 RepID=A0A7T5VF61_9BACT|nr:ABC transporter transmembrane domain-containing protein [Desulfobulbus oligotrophicus]MDY0389937.1 ABC transporter transmembrane domain-containing protein [Desulfobulbus oligotrophicus]QQG66805.1 ATP-binding cassette domain-containing protein [Desulfobulbus oligotrophicus]